MRTAGNRTYLMARQCEFPRHVTADRPGAEDADLHGSLLCHPTTGIWSSSFWASSGDFERHPPVFRDNRPMDKFAAMRVFVQIADAGNLSAAGRQLGVSLTSVSRHLMALEEALGTTLVERTTRHLLADGVRSALLRTGEADFGGGGRGGTRPDGADGSSVR